MAGGKFYDCVIIGGGHNGLVTAAYLAKAGKKVCVLERRHVLGGCSTTEELWPGFKVSTAAYVISLFLPEIIRDLQLKSHGLAILPRNPSSFTPTLDGRSLLMGPDEVATQKEIAKFSQRDAENYPKYNELLENVAKVIEPLLSRTAPDPIPMPKTWRKIGLTKRLRDASRLWDMYSEVGKLGTDLPAALELLTGAARPIVERWFESEPLRATLATDAIIGAFASISAPGTAYVLMHHVMGEAGGKRGVWGYVRGGMGGLATALENACRQYGVDIRREAPVARILADKGKVRGVQLVDGDTIEAECVGSSVDAHWTFEKFLDPDQLPPEFLAAVKNIDYASASAKVNLALSEPPNFTALPSTGVAPQHHGTMHVSPDIDYIERAYDDAKYGKPSASPILEMTMPTSVDNTIAPDGQHILSMFVQYAPYNLREGSWDDIKESFADRCVEVLAEYAPNVPGSILHRQVLSPLDLERTYGITGGNIMQGAMNFNQLFVTRPVPGWADHRTPVSGLYLCGAASHPGGGVMGAAGKNAAAEMLRDF
ncbi:phytoene desaturase family protein [Blastopirellula retiformator]|uniref:Pyridine nucleotide-disulfide oxidoreductase domain-containing protein 2 n=1 Tax=Blastopirellula retiformator TaxID=2527970 RepID=A0A5C5V454_9BACT|nr:NAD(P)/FAD-dependent oxidoreductase [Blastopirellula retiformator]TWT32719.1 zeta-carotene-forming phytoene desaturase [Blastopirellula retiformator]